MSICRSSVGCYPTTLGSGFVPLRAIVRPLPATVTLYAVCLSSWLLSKRICLALSGWIQLRIASL